MSERKTSSSFGIVGFGVAACAVCCAGPVLAFLGGLGLAGLVSAWFIGWAGVVMAALAAVAWVIVRRRRRASACVAPSSAAVSVLPPVRRTP